jgi:hypothetical protein
MEPPFPLTLRCAAVFWHGSCWKPAVVLVSGVGRKSQKAAGQPAYSRGPFRPVWLDGGTTFSGAATRFNEKRMLIAEEVNAIETAYLRLHLAPQRQGIGKSWVSPVLDSIETHRKRQYGGSRRK